MRSSTPLLTLWRVVLETRAPLSIATGRSDGVNDVVLAHDPNGVPMLPASSLAGVMRAALHERCGEAAADALFGSARGGDGNRGQVARLEIGHGHLHDSHGRPLRGLVARLDDPLLAPLAARRPAQRRRVRIDPRGAADDTGHFDRSLLPPGHRFSVELALWSSTAADEDEARVQALLAEGQLRVGALTRSGFGLLGWVRAHRRRFDFTGGTDWAAYAAAAADPDAVEGFAVVRPERPPGGPRRRVRLALDPQGGFRFGDGDASFSPQPGKLPDDLPASQRCVVWADGRGRLEEQARPLVPATSVKGALAHRVAFHAHRLARQWAGRGEGERPVAGYDKALHCPAVQRLFGRAPNLREQGREAGAGQAGLLAMSDVLLERAHVRAARRTHNSIDRFTGGVRDGLLFTFEDLHAQRRGAERLLNFELELDMARAQALGVTDDDLAALQAALEDVARGRLALGADSAGGSGWFEGEVIWDGDGRCPVMAGGEA